MDLIAIFRVLLRRRLWVAGIAGLAIVVGVLVGFRVSFTPLPSLQSRQYDVGQATIHVLVDTPSSQVADLDPPIGTDALISRASLFANLMATDAVQARVAQQAGIPVARLSVLAPSTTSPLIPTPLATQAGTTGAPSTPYLLSVRSDETLPLITMDATAPTAADAARLANGAFVALHEQVDHVADQQNIPAKRRPVLSALGGAAAGDVGRGPRMLYALVGSIVVFVVGCAAVVIGDGLQRRWRERDPEEPAPPAPSTNGVVREVNGTPREVTTHG